MIDINEYYESDEYAEEIQSRIQAFLDRKFWKRQQECDPGKVYSPSKGLEPIKLVRGRGHRSEVRNLGLPFPKRWHHTVVSSSRHAELLLECDRDSSLSLDENS